MWAASVLHLGDAEVVGLARLVLGGGEEVARSLLAKAVAIVPATAGLGGLAGPAAFVESSVPAAGSSMVVAAAARLLGAA